MEIPVAYRSGRVRELMWRGSGLMASALASGLSSPVRSPAETLRSVHGQDTLLSQSLSPPRYINGYRRI